MRAFFFGVGLLGFGCECEIMLCYFSDVLDTLRLEQSGCRFADDIFKCIFFDENICILIEISLKFVLKSRTDSHHGLRKWFGAASVTSHYLNL